MRWPPWSSNPKDDDTVTNKARSSWDSPNPPFDLSYYTTPDVVIPSAILTTAILTTIKLHQLYLRRIPGATKILPSFYRKRSLFGRVTSVGDGDGFRLFHTPGGLLAGWGWLRKIPTGKALKDNTISIRIAGVDAPEGAHFGHTAQPGSKEAIEWLTSYVLGRRVRAYVYKKDQYDRAVATVYVRRWLLRSDVGLQMLKKGLATVYEAKTGSEFGELEDRYRATEWWARKKKVGIWKTMDGFESPREYKKRMGGSEIK